MAFFPVCPCVQISFFLRMLVFGFRAYPTPVWPCFQIRPHSQDSGGHEIWGDIIQFRTFSFLFLINVCVVFTKKQHRRGFKSGAAERSVWIPAHHLLAITSWPGCLNSVSLSFLIYKMGYDNQTYLRDLLWEEACKAQCLSDDIGSHSSCFLQSSSWINTF